MPMQDNINEIYRMRQEADDRERQELLELLKAQNKELKAKVEELTRENNNAKKEQKKAEGELEAVKKKQAEQWVRMLLCVISTLTLSTTGSQKVDQKDDSVKPMKVYY